MRNIIIVMILAIGLIFTSFIKNKTRLLEKELVNLNIDIDKLNLEINDTSIDYQYLTTPKSISYLANQFLDDDFSYYKKSQIIKLSEISEHEENLVISEVTNNEKSLSKIKFKKLVSNNYNLIKYGNNKKILDKKIKNTRKKIERWAGLQAVKAMLGIPPIPGTDY